MINLRWPSKAPPPYPCCQFCPFQKLIISKHYERLINHFVSYHGNSKEDVTTLNAFDEYMIIGRKIEIP